MMSLFAQHVASFSNSAHSAFSACSFLATLAGSSPRPRCPPSIHTGRHGCGRLIGHAHLQAGAGRRRRHGQDDLRQASSDGRVREEVRGHVGRRSAPHRLPHQQRSHQVRTKRPQTGSPNACSSLGSTCGTRPARRSSEDSGTDTTFR